VESVCGDGCRGREPAVGYPSPGAGPSVALGDWVFAGQAAAAANRGRGPVRRQDGRDGALRPR